MTSARPRAGESLRAFWLTLAGVWAVAIAAALGYARLKDLPNALVAALLPAFLLEIGFYLAAGTAALRERLELLPKARLAALLVAAAAAPYLLYAFATRTFEPTSLAMLAALAAMASFWYVYAGRSPAADAGFLILMAAVFLARPFPHLYAEPESRRIGVAILGQTMWIRTGIVAVLSIRRMQGIGLGFLPGKKDWQIGAIHFALFLPVGLLAAWLLQFARLSRDQAGWQMAVIAVVTFAGILWVVALPEEFFFRGMLQQRLDAFLPRGWALGIASCLFGLAHLGFAGRFPNWKFVALATVAGFFYGRAYSQAGSIRAPMVTHAMVVTVWRVFLQ